MKILQLLLSVPLAATLTLPPAQAANEYPWVENLKTAEELSKLSGKPMLAAFR